MSHMNTDAKILKVNFIKWIQNTFLKRDKTKIHKILKRIIYKRE